MIFNFILFIIVFCFYCYLVPKNNLSASPAAEDSMDSFIPQIKEAFSDKFDPEPEVVEQRSNPSVFTSQILCLPPAKSSTQSTKSVTQTRRCNQVQPITNGVLTTPSKTPTQAKLPTISRKSTYQELKQFVKEHNLQQMVKNALNKPYNRCKKQELLEVLTA